MERKARNNTLDMLRMLAAFSVVWLHAMSGSGYAWGEEIVAAARFAVPLFFLISGYFAAGFTARRRLRQIGKIALLLLLACAGYAVIRMSGYIYLQGALNYLKSSFRWDNLSVFLFFNQPLYSEHLWFLSAMLYCLVLDGLFAWLCKRRAGRWVTLALALVLLIGGLVFYHMGMARYPFLFKLYYYRNFLFFGLPLFLFGRVIRLFGKLDALRVPGWAFGLLAAAGVALSVLEMRRIGTWELYFPTLLTAGGLFFLALRCPHPDAHGPLFALAEAGRRYSLPIYIVHIFFLEKINQFFYAAVPWEQYGTWYYFVPLAAFLLSLLTAAVYDLLKRFVLGLFQKGQKNAA